MVKVVQHAAKLTNGVFGCCITILEFKHRFVVHFHVRMRDRIGVQFDRNVSRRSRRFTARRVTKSRPFTVRWMRIRAATLPSAGSSTRRWKR